MTRLSVRQDAPRSGGASRLAALHHHAGQWRLVVARIAGGGVEVVACRSAADPAALAPVVREHRAERLLVVIPASRTVCRAAALPEGAADDPAAAAAALALIAEADLPVSIPAHRRAGGVLRPAGAPARPIPVLVGWPEAPADEPSPPTFDLDQVDYVPEIVALAALAAAPLPAGGGGAPAALATDPATGTVAILAAGAARSVARVLRLDHASPQAWADAVAQVAAESAQAAGLERAAILPRDETGSGPVLAFAPAAGAPPGGPRLAGAQADPAWRRDYGLPLGAILAAASPDPSLAPLTRLRPEAPGRDGSRLLEVVTWLSVPRRAAAAVALCAAVVLLWPLGVAAARTWTLQARSGGGAAALRERLEAARQEVTLYEVLRARRWPMTKLLADVASATPVGVTVESVELSPEQGANAGLTLRASAESADQIAVLRKNLSDTRIFEDISTPTMTSEGERGLEFRLQARVAGPLLRVPPAEDFAAKPLADRLYGDGASAMATAAPHARDSGPADGRGSRWRRENSTGGGRDRAGGASADRPGPAAAAPPAPRTGEIPAPITDEEIARLDRAAAMREFTSRNSAANAAGLEEATRARLRDEAAKARRRMIEATREAAQ
jgi:hypothetical protein